MKKIAIAAVLALGAASYSLPAAALADDYGQFVWTDQSPSRFAPDGIAIDSRRFQSTIPFTSGSAAPAQDASTGGVDDVFERIDRAHKAW
ncbi:MAG: hypothetical protein KDJ29_20580 [Hyphomicrobiales bacterium]|nr:hypothetical protein [Hyphomicrobiales bacterium]